MITKYYHISVISLISYNNSHNSSVLVSSPLDKRPQTKVRLRRSGNVGKGLMMLRSYVSPVSPVQKRQKKIKSDTSYDVGNRIFKGNNILSRDAFMSKQQPEPAGTVLHSLKTGGCTWRGKDEDKRSLLHRNKSSKFRSLISLCNKWKKKKNGADISPSYDNHVRYAEMISTIAGEMKSGLAEEFRRAVKRMIDANEEPEMVYVHSEWTS